MVYADLFDAPISVEEVARTALGVRLSPDEVRKRVGAPPLSDLLTLNAEGILTLRGREDLVALREDGVRRTAALLDQHHKVIGALASLPYVRMLPFGADFGRAVPALRTLALAVPLQFVNCGVLHFFIARDRGTLNLAFAAAMVVINGGMNLALDRHLGAVGA